MNRLVESIGAEYTPRNSYSATLQAALTLDEVNQRISQAGLQGVMVYHLTGIGRQNELGNKRVVETDSVGSLHRTPASLFTGLKTDPEWLHQQTIRFLAG